MDYKPMTPPFELKPFKEMNKEETKRYFNWYVSEIPNRIEMLKNFFELSGGGKKEMLDLSVDSLKILWGWFLGQIKIEKKTQDEIKNELDSSPKWLHSEILKNKNKISDESKLIAYDISIYFAEVVRKNMKNIKWGFMTSPKSYIAVNEPILTWFKNKTPMEPRNLIEVQCSIILDGEKNPNALYDLFFIRKKHEIE